VSHSVGVYDHRMVESLAAVDQSICLVMW